MQQELSDNDEYDLFEPIEPINEEEQINNVKEFAKELKEKVESENMDAKNPDGTKIIDNHQVPPIKVKFNVLATFFTKMSQVRGKKKIELLNILAEYFFKPPRIAEHTFTIIRLIIPFQDRDRGVYKLQEKNLAKLFKAALGLTDDDYQRMANYKHASMQPYGAPVGDFPMVVKDVIKGLCRNDCIISITEVDNLLDNLVKAQNSKDQELIIIQIIQKCTADEILWIIRIILKDLKIGLKYEKLLQLFHRDAPEYYNATSSLKEVCKEFVDVNHSLRNVLRLFHPIKPMLAAKKSPEEIRRLFEGQNMIVETKYDGERIQCHFTPDVIRFFTRNSNDYTHIYKNKMGDVVRQSVDAACAILDGEIVVVDKTTGNNVQFGLNKTVAQDTDVTDNTYGLCYKIFDILYLKTHQNQEINTMSLPLSTRRELMNRIIHPIVNQLEIVNIIKINTFDQLIHQFDLAILRNEEGIIIKQEGSQYLPNERSTKWVKMKGDYVENLTDTCDLLVIGGYFGTQSHRVDKYDDFDRITHFLMGLASKIDKNQPTNSLFLPFVKVGTGFTDNELSTIRNKLRNNWISKQKPSYIPNNWNPGVNDRPDLYISNPAHSLIFEVKAAEITKSNTFPTDYTLRFPRCFKTRMDKEWYEVMTIQDLQHMINDSQYTKNMKKKADSGDSKQGSDDEIGGDNRQIRQAKQRKQPGKRGALTRQVAVMPEFLGVDPTNIAKESNLFQSFEFYLVNIKEEYDKHYLETVIISQGGSCIQNFIENTVTHVIASIEDFKIKTIIQKQQTTIIKPSWIIECVRRQQLVSLAPRFILYTPIAIYQELQNYFDRYGDPYFEQIDDQALIDICETINIENEQIDIKDLQELESELLKSLPNLWVFDQQILYPYCQQHQLSNDELEILKSRIKARGGKIANDLKEKVDYIILFPQDTFIQQKELERYLDLNPGMKTTTIQRVMKLLEE